MWWQFRAAFVRKLGYILAALVVGLVLGHRAHAVTYLWNDTSHTACGAGTATQIGSCVAPIIAQGGSGSSPGVYIGITSGTELPTGLTPGSMTYTYCQYSIPGDTPTCVTTRQLSVTTIGGVPAGACGANQAKHYPVVVTAGVPAPSGSSMCGGDGCLYTMDSPQGGVTYDPFQKTTTTGVKPVAMQSGMNTGQACAVQSNVAEAGAPMSQGAPSQTCASSGANVACQTQSASGVNCGTYNGDEVCVSAIPAGSCQSYASGGSACVLPSGATTMPTPPGPDNGTAGTSATPTEVVTTNAGTANYYSSAVVGASSKPVTTGTTGNASGAINNNPTIVGGGSGTAASAACPPGQTCGGTDAYSGGTDCVTPPACTDTDPVQCGIVNQEWLFRCESASESQIQSAITTVGGSVGQVAASSVDMSDVLSESNAGTWGSVSAGSGECPAPLAVTIMGRSVTFDLWGKVCEFAGMISFIVLAVAYMVAARVTYMGAVSNSF